MGAVTELNLDDNQIHRIPAETGNLTSLVKLSMRHNLIDAIPDQLMLCRHSCSADSTTLSTTLSFL
ncbi:hypothetical protein T484DRAFT_1807649 [Baffinella frigidus]|nr:hypothetical protein T484DRAFT_1807649 [Cryptophyta sp. CCMP2293]